MAISNPGHSGFSIRESELWGNEEGTKVARFLQDAVSWAIFEERPHTSKLRESGTRRKFYLHPLLSPAFAIPYVRSKEPLYTTVKQVHKWIFGNEPVMFKGARALGHQEKVQGQQQLPIRWRH